MSSRSQINMKDSKLSLFPVTEGKQTWLKSKIRDVPHFPKPGITFKDLTTLFQDAEAFTFVLDVLASKCKELDAKYIAGIEARGFILAAAVAYKLGLGFIPIRKPGKLPHIVESASYELEYGNNTVEIHRDACEPGSRVVLLDDLLATGGTAGAGVELLQKIGAEVVGLGFIVELGFLSGRAKLQPGLTGFSLLTYE